VSQNGLSLIQGVYNPLMRDTTAKASMAVTTSTMKANHGGDHYMIPFFFGEDWTKVLPLVALQYHDVEIRIKCRDGYTPVGTPKVYGNYIYLDTDERKYFADSEHELLITQTQYQPARKLTLRLISATSTTLSKHSTSSQVTQLGVTTGTTNSLSINLPSTSTVCHCLKILLQCTTTQSCPRCTALTSPTTSSRIFPPSHGLLPHHE